MPKYIYRCDRCEEIFELVHSMKDKLEICEECEGSLIRIPSLAFINSGQKKAAINHKVGDLVKDHIEESKRELRKEQERIGTEEYK
jgi:putative FmdB family regulatory protein